MHGTRTKTVPLTTVSVTFFSSLFQLFTDNVGHRSIKGCNLLNPYLHGLRTPNEGINQRYNLKNWADVTDKICFGRTEKFGSGSEFSAMQWRLFPLWASVVRAYLLTVLLSISFNKLPYYWPSNLTCKTDFYRFLKFIEKKQQAFLFVFSARIDLLN